MQGVKLELDSICRVCLESNEVVPIFGANGEDTIISLKFNQCSSIELVHGDQMPDLICLSCFYDLETAYRFRTNCESSDAILKSFIDTDVLGDQPIIQQLVEPDLVDSADQSIVELMADDKSIIMELSDPIQSDADGDGDGDADDATDTLPSDPTTTATNGLIHNDSIIQGLEFLEGDGGMMKLKVLGQDEYVEYHVNVADVAMLNNDATFQLVQHGFTAENSNSSLSPLQSTEHVERNTVIVNNIGFDEYATNDSSPNIESVEQPNAADDDNLYVDEANPDDPAAMDGSRPPNDDAEEYENDDEEDANICHIKLVQTNKFRLEGRGQAAAAAAAAAAGAAEAADAEGSTGRAGRRAVKAMKKCDICGNEYKYQNALNGHMRRHRNEKPFKCSICGKGFVINFELSRHLRTHTGHKPYACSFCERRFSDFGSRVKHERTHTGERPYPCDECGKAFTYSHVLSSHKLTHSGYKRFGCEKCSKRFAKSHHLKAHMNTHDREQTRLRGLMAGDGVQLMAATMSTTTTTTLTGSTADASGSQQHQHQHIDDVDVCNFNIDAMVAADDDDGGGQTPVLLYADADEAREGDLMLSMADRIITDGVTGENYVLDMSELEEDAKATVHLIHFNANDLGN